MNQDLHKKIDEKIDQVLDSLDGVQKAEANFFLYGKIRNRMMLQQQVLPSNLLRMALSLTVVVVMNVITVRHISAAAAPANGSELIATEYAISLPETY